MRPLRTAARGMLGAIFVASGARTLADPEQHVQRAKPVTDRIAPALERAHPKLPTDTRTLIRINGIVQLAGGLLLATRWGRRPAAAALAVSLVPTTAAGHPFWTYDDPAQRSNQQIHFLKNVGLLGGLLVAAGDTEGRPSMRWRAGRLVRDTRRSMRYGQRGAMRQVTSARRQVTSMRRQARRAGRAAITARRLPW
jgi:putative oxidoreductase